jgi:dTDP-4-dehydrorhamnose reductase
VSKIVILGATGMLGTAVSKVFADFDGEVFGTKRGGAVGIEIPGLNYIDFDAATDDLAELPVSLAAGDYIVNCIGIIKPYIKDDKEDQRKTALLINGLLPHKLAEFASRTDVKVIQIATDCVYSGFKGDYVETDLHDALDVYGKTKSLGEVPNANLMHLRVSIIGPEYGRSTSLLEWVRNQPQNAEIGGFTDHLWNGVPTKHFGKLARGIIEGNLFAAGVHHIIPADQIDKFTLVSKIAETFGRADIVINPRPSGHIINRTLQTANPEFNAKLWASAGYAALPTVEQLVSEIPD